MNATNPVGNTVKTVDTAFDILELLRETDGMRVSELASELGLAKSTVHRHLQTLYRRGYLVREGDVFHVGFRFLELGEYSRRRKSAYVKAREKVSELAVETGERVQFIVESRGHAFYLYREMGEHGVQTDPGVGHRVPLHATAAGKSILAFLPAERVEEILERRGLAAETENTTTDREALLEELATVREQGYCLNDQELIDGLRAVGAPVKGRNDQVIGAISIAGPTHRLKDQVFRSELPDLLLGTVNELELNIVYS